MSFEYDEYTAADRECDRQDDEGWDSPPGGFDDPGPFRADDAHIHAERPQDAERVRDPA